MFSTFHRKKSIIATGLYFLLALQPAVAETKNEEEKNSKSLYTRIATQALPVHAELKNIFELKDEESYDPEKQKYDLTVQALSEFEKRNTFFSIFHKHGNKENKNDSKVFIDDYWKDLDFFCGPTVNKKASIFNSINYTKTIPGEIVLQRMLSQATINIKKLSNWQSCIKELSNNKNLTKLLGQQLTTFSKTQNHLLTFWKNENSLTQESFKNVYFSFNLGGLNQSAFSLEALRRANNFMDVVFTPLTFPISLIANIAKSIPRIMQEKKCSFKEACGELYTTIKVLPKIGKCFFADQSKTSLEKLSVIGGGTAMLALTLAFSAYCTYIGIKKFKFENKITTYLQERLIAVSTTIRTLKELAHIVKTNNVLSKHISTKNIDALEEKNSQLSTLINMLATNTFTGEPSFFSLSGRVLAAYKIMMEAKNLIVPAFEDLGKIDALYSCNVLRKKFENSDHRYCYPKYIKNSEQPYFRSDAFWFPGLLNDKNLKKVVTNSIEMGSLHGKEQNILLTGPNAGGKSTILKGIVTSIILAQTIGIAPAATLELTPFSKIQTYINIVDSASEGVSTFRAELNRARDLLNTITDLPQKEFSFTIFDEVFRGTNPEEAIQGSAYLAAILGKRENSMSIIATHFGLLTKLEDLLPGIYTNYQVTAIKRETCFHYPFTWQPGISKHKIAIDLMRFENLKDSDGLSMAEKFGKLINEYGIR